MTASERHFIPGPAYIDSSALVRLYVPSQNSAALDAVLAGRSDLMVSDLALTEVTSAVCRLRAEGALDGAAVHKIHSRLLHHADGGIFETIDLHPTVCRAAEMRLLHAQGIPLRAGDALHLEVALAGGCRTMVTFDRRLAAASRKIGLSVFPG